MIKISISQVEDGRFIIRAEGLNSVFGSIEKSPAFGHWHLELAGRHSDHVTFLKACNAAFKWARNAAIPPAPSPAAKVEPTPKPQPVKPYAVKGRSKRRDPALRPLRYHLAALACCLASVGGIVAAMMGA
jgi:hypothetical protein